MSLIVAAMGAIGELAVKWVKGSAWPVPSTVPLVLLLRLLFLLVIIVVVRALVFLLVPAPLENSVLTLPPSSSSSDGNVRQIVVDTQK
jgi:hypothetical protein